MIGEGPCQSGRDADRDRGVKKAVRSKQITGSRGKHIGSKQEKNAIYPGRKGFMQGSCGHVEEGFKKKRNMAGW